MLAFTIKLTDIPNIQNNSLTNAQLITNKSVSDFSIWKQKEVIKIKLTTLKVT